MRKQETVICDYLKWFIEPGQVTELRAFGDHSYSGWFDHDHLESMAKAAVELQASCRGIYFTPNPIKTELLSRRANQVGLAGKCTTDADIIGRNWMLIDIDPVRPTGSNATEEERQHAWQVANHVQACLSAANFSDPVIASSGNGWHLSYPIYVDNNDESRDQAKMILAGLDKRCSTEHAKVDLKTFNASRIWKLYGTSARKGPNSNDRPHRTAFVATNPMNITPSIRKKNTLSVGKMLSMWSSQERVIIQLESQRVDSEATTRARSYLKNVPGAVSGSGGHDHTFHVCMVLCEGFGLDSDSAYALLSEWNATCNPPWTESELRHKVTSVISKVSPSLKGSLLSQVKSAPVKPQIPSKVYLGPDSVPDVEPDDDIDATAGDLVRLQATITWTWPNWIQRGTLTCLASDPGVGKTRLCADITKRIWHNLPWPDGTPNTLPKESRVLWVASDSQWSELGTLPKEFGFPPEAIILNGRKSNPYAGTNLDSIEDLADFERRIMRVKPALVFVDTVGNATDRNQGRPEEAKQFFKPLAEIATRTGTSIVLVTHLNRGGQVLGNRIIGAVRQVVMLEMPEASPDNWRKLTVSKTNSMKPPALGVTMGSNGNTYEIDSPGAGPSAPKAGRPAHLEGDMEWMREYLALGAKRVSVCRTDAAAASIGVSRLYKAKDGLQVVEYEVENRLWWRLPDE